MSLKVVNLFYQVGEHHLLSGVDFTLDDHSITLLMGPNGSGKSLLLALMHGLIQPSGGNIQWQGRALSAVEFGQQAMVFQRPVLLRRSVLANINFALKLRQKPNNKLALSYLEQVGLAPLAAQAAQALSGGEQQRLALARALALQPKLLFLDEPTANLDPASTAVIEKIVRQESVRGCKIVFVTHDPGQAKRLGDEVVFLNRGRVCEHQPISDFLTQPQSPEARGFLSGQLVI